MEMRDDAVSQSSRAKCQSWSRSPITAKVPQGPESGSAVGRKDPQVQRHVKLEVPRSEVGSLLLRFPGAAQFHHPWHPMFGTPSD